QNFRYLADHLPGRYALPGSTSSDHFSFEDDAADYERNLGAITTALGRFEVARSHFQKASEIYLRLQIDHDAAWCQHNIGSIWWHVASAADPVEHPVLLRRALRWLVPATVFLEGMRFQFTAAADRVAWARRIERSTRSLFEVATELGDEVLVADLIESAINAGVHTIASGDDMLSARAVGVFAGLTDLRETGQRLTSEVASTITGAGSSRHRENTGGQNSPDARGIHLGGTSRLIAGARLPMRPPPRLRMPDAHLALEPWTITYPGAHDYPPLQRSPQEIAIT
ncbi:tetratricopeptide repeat protein, partial [Rhodococcus qingshengii]